MPGKKGIYNGKRRQVGKAVPPSGLTSRQAVRQLQRKRNKQSKKNGKSDSPINASQLRKDPRTASPSAGAITSSNAQSAIILGSIWSAEPVHGVVLAYLSKAYERGFFAAAESPFDPYFAAVYMAKVLAQAQQGTFDLASQMPYWFLALCRAVKPKKAPFGTGLVSYKWVAVDPDAPFANIVSIGWPTFGYEYSMGIVTDFTLVNFFPTVTTAGFPGYDDTLGANAFNQLVSFMANQSGLEWEKKLSKSVPIAQKTSLDDNVSAFIQNVETLGVGFAGAQSGGIELLMQNEVPIFTPFIGLMGCRNPNVLGTPRNFNRNHCFAGDTMFLGGMMSTSIPEAAWGFKEAPKLYPVDFLEFLNVLAKWCTLILQGQYSNPGQNPGIISKFPACPLTLQEVGLLLRNTMMGAWKNSQFAVQAIYPYVPSDPLDNQFVPFVSDVGTCSLQTLDMMLPAPMIENIRALSPIWLKNEKNGMPEFFFPILGKYNTDRLLWSDYQAEQNLGGVITNIPVFKDPTVIFQRQPRTKDEKVTFVPEIAISYVDGSYGGGKVAINDPTRLKQLIALWNEWLTGPVGSFTVALGTYSSEGGFPVLRSVGTHRHWYTGGPGILRTGRTRLGAEPHKPHDTSVVDVRQKKRNATLSPYLSKFGAAVTSVGQIIPAAYENVLQVWILPVNQIQHDTTDQDALFPRIQAIYKETSFVALTAGPDGVILEDLHQTYAAKMTRGELAQTDDWVSLIKTTAAKAEGGILSGILASVVGAAFPAIGGVANTVASMLPI